DVEAFATVVRFCVQNDLSLYVHDDSSSSVSRSAVTTAVTELGRELRMGIHVVRRAQRVGGKAGAVNNVVANLEAGVEFLLLCDCDSFLLAPDILVEVLPWFEDRRLALIQLQNVGFVHESDSPAF